MPIKLQEFLKDREGLSADRVTILKYLDKVCDLTIEPAQKGRSKITCYFDDGAYKGGQSFTTQYQHLTPTRIASALQNLTDGWSFSFVDADKALLNAFNQRVEQENKDAD